LLASSCTVRVPPFGPGAVGWNPTIMKQFCFGASVVMAVKQVVPLLIEPMPSENVAEMRVMGDRVRSLMIGP
jgi:hypothetical protein